MAVIERGVNPHVDLVADALDNGRTLDMSEVVALAQEVVRLQRGPDVAPLSRVADAAARSIAEETNAKIGAIPTTDTERMAIKVRVAELIGGPRT
jgi:hypothetical protein